MFTAPASRPVRQDRARVEMDTVAYVEHGGALAGGSMQVDGDLTLRQTSPLSVYGGTGFSLLTSDFSSPPPPLTFDENFIRFVPLAGSLLGVIWFTPANPCCSCFGYC